MRVAMEDVVYFQRFDCVEEPSLVSVKNGERFSSEIQPCRTGVWRRDADGIEVGDRRDEFRGIERPVVAETTALGAAYLAGLAVGYWDSTDDVTRNWALDRRFEPAMPSEDRNRLYTAWKKAVTRSLDWEEHDG